MVVSSMKPAFYILCIFLLTTALRVYGVNWDQNQHLHPDERFLTMVGTAARVPETFGEYMDPARSTLNPYNLNFGFYVYGTLPVTLNKLVVKGTSYDSYDGFVIAGRYMSAAFDVGTMLLVMLLAHLLVKMYVLDKRLPYVAGFLYAVAVLPIQNAHFFTVDSFLTFFITLSVVCALRARFGMSIFWLVASGIALGLALATKVSAIYALPLIAGIALINAIYAFRRAPRSYQLETLLLWILGVLVFTTSTYFALRIGDPRMFATPRITDFSLNPTFVANIEQLKSFSTPSIGFPPSVQWLSKKPIIFPLQNIAFFGLGLVYFALSTIGLVRMGLSKKPLLIIITIWLLGFFAYQGSRLVTSMRYFYPMYPYLALAGAVGLLIIVSKTKQSYQKAMLCLLVLGILIWPLSFMAIYTRPHSRVSASEWIYKNIPSNAYIITEYWDDPLPSTLPGYQHGLYKGSQIAIFDQDSSQKTLSIMSEIAKADYWILSSNRAYGSILQLPDEYPITSKLYEDLFSGELGFELASEFTSYPALKIDPIYFELKDQWSEEAFTVYDHPRVLIFRRSQQQ